MIGENIKIIEPRSFSRVESNCVTFITNKSYKKLIDSNLKNFLCISSNTDSYFKDCTLIIHENPRLAFCLVLNKFFLPRFNVKAISKEKICASAKLGKHVYIAEGVYIGENVKIGDNTIIEENVVIKERVVIGKGCRIKPNTTIGSKGFGFVNDENNIPIQFPHLGNVIIGDNVEIGANCSIASAALDETIINNYVKIDDQVHIAHNCIIGEKSKIAAGVILSGSVVIGENVWISPNVTIIDYGVVENNSFVGIGSVVTKPVREGQRVFGIPASPITRKRKK